MRKHRIFGDALAFCLSVIIALALAGPVFAQDTTNSGTYTDRGSYGTVDVEPSGESFNISILAVHVRSGSSGSGDYLYLSSPNGTSDPVPVAIITNNEESLDFNKAVYNGTAVWTPPDHENVILVNTSDFEVWLGDDDFDDEDDGDEDNALFVNLTAPVEITLPLDLANDSLPFTLPALSIMFEETDDNDDTDKIETMPSLPSGAKITFDSEVSDAYVYVTCSIWNITGTKATRLTGTFASEATITTVLP
ncbi:MAG: hypothetical protein NWF00_12265 [Candidatus Bathyarchaeota archaeon]|nr:hypothetical protein [Candidatus Bathyarchaeota archaeon]